MAEISIDYEDLSAARSYVESGLHIVDHWSWMRDAEYSDRMKRAAMIYRHLKDAEKASDLDRLVNGVSR